MFFFVFIIPFVIFIDFLLIGRLYLTEVFLALTALILVIKNKTLNYKELRVYVVLGILWLFSNALSDFIHKSSYSDYLRAWSQIIFFLTSLLGIYLLAMKKSRYLILFFYSLIFGLLVKTQINPWETFSWDIWKFGYALPVNALGVLISSHFWNRSYYKTSILLVIILCMVNLSLGFRAAFGQLLFESVLLFFILHKIRKGIIPNFKKYNFFKLTIVGISVILLSLLVYKEVALNGLMGPEEKNKYLIQANGPVGFLSVIFTGRLPLYVTLASIYDSPIIGNGSYSFMATSIKYQYLSLVEEGMNSNLITDSQFNEGRVITHSFLLNAWAQAGFLGLLFWLFTLKDNFSKLLSLVSRSNYYTPFILFLGISLFWNILFTPFDAVERIIAAFTIAILIHVTKGSFLKKDVS